MSFLSDLAQWFVSGRSREKTAAEPDRPAPIEPDIPPPESLDFETRADDLDFADTRDTILFELKKLGSVSRDFDRARDELIRELKNIALRRRAKA